MSPPPGRASTPPATINISGQVRSGQVRSGLLTSDQRFVCWRDVGEGGRETLGAPRPAGGGGPHLPLLADGGTGGGRGGDLAHLAHLAHHHLLLLLQPGDPGEVGGVVVARLRHLTVAQAGEAVAVLSVTQILLLNICNNINI